MISLRAYSISPILLTSASLIISGSLHAEIEAALIALAANESSGTIVGSSDSDKITNIELSRGLSLDAFDAFPGYYDSSSWSTVETFPGVDSGSYVELSFDVAPNYTFIVENFSFYYEDGGDLNGPARVELRSSLDGFATSQYTDTNTFNFQVDTFSPASGSDTVSSSVAFRFYGYGAGNSNGILGFTNNATLQYSGEPVSILIDGDLEPVPEAQHFSLLMACVALCVSARRRRWRLL